jgi:hypothetical protein
MLIPGQGFRDNDFNNGLGSLVAGFMNVIVAFWGSDSNGEKNNDLYRNRRSDGVPDLMDHLLGAGTQR